MTVEQFLANPPREIVRVPDPILTSVASMVTDFSPWDKIVEVMVWIRDKYAALGLSAPQVGLPYAVFITQDLVCINPEIIMSGRKEIVEQEGCLSIPGVYVPVKRPDKITARWKDLKGREFCKKLNGYSSRVFQHEYDHLRGILITNEV